MGDFSKARKGDPCFSVFGNGPDSEGHNDTIHDVDLTSSMVLTMGGQVARLNGHALSGSQMPILFHSKPSFNDPPPPKRMVKKWVAWHVRKDGSVEPMVSPAPGPVKMTLFPSPERVMLLCGNNTGMAEVEVPEE